MGIAQFHAKEEQHDGCAYDQTPLKIHKDSNFLTRLPPSSTTTSSTTTTTTSDGLTNKLQQQHQQSTPPRRPVIIYTHSPKVIHTHPRDFMALVQKLTGYTPPPENTKQTQDRRHHHRGQGNTEDNESTSVVTEEHGSSVNDIPQVNSCFVDGGVGIAVGPPPYRAAGFDPFYNPTPVFSANPPTDYFCGSHHQLPFYNSDHSLYLNRNSLSSSSLRGLKEYPEI